jgi:hypothetical protein
MKLALCTMVLLTVSLAIKAIMDTRQKGNKMQRIVDWALIVAILPFAIALIYFIYKKM